MATLKEIFSERLKRLQSVPDKFVSETQKAEAKIIAGILQALDQLEVKNGLIVKNTRNLTAISQIASDIKSVILQSNYTKAVKEFIGEFDEQAILTDAYFDVILDGAPKATAFADAALANSQKQAVKYLLEAPMDADFIQPLETILSNNVRAGASFTQTLKAIQDYASMEGNDEGGRLAHYAKQIAYDSFATSDRAYLSERSDALGFEWFIYSGGELPTSRAFCIARHGKYYHKKEIESWVTNSGSEESNPVPHKEWDGMFKDQTNKQTIFSLAGGHNCRHIIAPVSLNSVPEEVVQRNVDSGNYEP